MFFIIALRRFFCESEYSNLVLHGLHRMLYTGNAFLFCFKAILLFAKTIMASTINLEQTGSFSLRLEKRRFFRIKAL